MIRSEREHRPRVLIVDDNPAIHDDFRKILSAKSEAQDRLEEVEEMIFGAVDNPSERLGFRLDSAHQGQEALAMVQQAVKEGDPYIVAFVDIRMPPGWDGVETLERIWECDPELQAVVCTAYSDYSWDQMIARLGRKDNLLILKKPFETVEVLQMAHALTQKWQLARQLNCRVDDLNRTVHQRTVELHVSEERFSTAFDCNPNPAAILSLSERRFLEVNPAFLELTGYTAEQLAERSDTQLQLWSTGGDANGGAFAPDKRARHWPCRLRRQNGEERQILLSCEPLSFGGVAALLIIAEDISERLKLESQLRQAQKMEVIGRMAAGIAHEFNNVLTIIQGNVGMLQSAPPQIDKNVLLQQIMNASTRAAAFTKQILAFSRKQVLQARLVDVGSVVRSLEPMLSRLVGEKYEIQLRCSDQLPPVLADEAGLEQVLINLALNARDAMPDGGAIEVCVAHSELDETTATGSADARPGRFVCVTVTDHGCGMEAHVLPRIFDPFFTTKDVGKGTGLGLATIHGIVKQHSGWITVTSELGRGSTFRVFLPVAEDTAASRVQAPARPARPRLNTGKGEVILFVEDEQSLRELACAVLEHRGFQVLSAASGPEALQLVDSTPLPVRLLLTDMVMPCGMTGGELAKILQERNPEVKVLYTSGYSPDLFRKDSKLLHGINFVPKPYDFETLVSAVRATLNGEEFATTQALPVPAPQKA